MPSGMDSYLTLYEMLDRVGVRNVRDLARLKSHHKDVSPQLGISSDDYGWVTDIFLEAKACFYQQLERVKALKGPVLCFPYAHDRVTDFDFHNVRAKYSCYLPDLSVHVCGSLVEDLPTQGTPTRYFLYRDYLFLLLFLKPLIVNNMAIVVPRRYAVYDYYGSTKRSIQEVYGHNDIIEIDVLKPLYIPQVLQAGHGIPDAAPGALALPYLERVDLERYVDVVQNNRDLFSKVSAEFRCAIDAKGGDSFIPSWVQAYNSALVDVQLAYEKASSELHRKGIDVAVGLTLTVFSLVFPGLSETTRAALAALGSSKSVSDGLGWISDFRRLPGSLRDRAGWFLWRSQKK